MTVFDLKRWPVTNRVPSDTIIGFHDHYGKLIPLHPADLTLWTDARALGERPPHVCVSPPYIGEEPE